MSFLKWPDKYIFPIISDFNNLTSFSVSIVFFLGIYLSVIVILNILFQKLLTFILKMHVKILINLMGGTFFFFFNLDFSKLELLFAHVLIGHAHNNSEIEYYLKTT